jgi:hypothetical protein
MSMQTQICCHTIPHGSIQNEYTVRFMNGGDRFASGRRRSVSADDVVPMLPSIDVEQQRIRNGSSRNRMTTIWTKSSGLSLPLCALIIMIKFTMDQTTVQSFVLLSGHNSQSGKPCQESVNNYFNSFALFARPARNLQEIRRKQQEQLQHQQEHSEYVDDSEDDIPANLKRKVQAKRPALGHVVPAATRVKGCKMIKSHVLAFMGCNMFCSHFFFFSVSCVLPFI